MLFEVELTVDLQIAVINDLHLVYLAKLDLVSQRISTLEILPDRARNVNEPVALINAMNVARVLGLGPVRGPDVVVFAGAPTLIRRENLDDHEDVAAKK